MRKSQCAGATFSADEALDPKVVRARLETLYPELSIQSRSRFKLAAAFIDDVLRERKTTTIRYTHHSVEYPSCPELPVYRANDQPGDAEAYVGTVRIIGLCYKPFGALTEVDANRDGFSNAVELKEKLRDIYGDIRDNEIVTIFAITSAAGASASCAQ